VKRVPLVPTLVVGLAVAAMIALGLWQLLDRLPQKDAFIAQLRANPTKSAIAYPIVTDERLLFRQSSVRCLESMNQRLAGAGAAGYRVIVDCRTGAEGPGAIVQLGTTRDPGYQTRWNGGAVSGTIGHAPVSRSLIGSLFDHTPTRLMLIAREPVAGLAANAAPDPESVPNNHLSYAVQWFLFAGIAVVIYLIALRRRG
jgi:surfeit locus 1 family protein